MSVTTRHLVLFGSAILVAGALTGCRIKRTYPSQPVRIVGTSYYPGAAFQMVPPGDPGAEWLAIDTVLSGSIMASGQGVAPSVALDALQGKLLAKQMAKQAARRKLAEKIEMTEVRPGVTVADLITTDSEKRATVEEFIRTARHKGVIEAEAGTCTVFLTLDLRPLNRILRGGTLAAADAASTFAGSLSEEEFRERARKEATENARARLLDYLKSLRLPDSGSLGDRMLYNDEIDRAIRRRVELLDPVVRFVDENTCEAAIIMDLADVQAILDQNRDRFSGRWPKLPKWLQRRKPVPIWRPPS